MDRYSQHGAATGTAGSDAMPEAADADAWAAAMSPVLPLALSARLGLDPAELTALRSDMFATSEYIIMQDLDT